MISDSSFNTSGMEDGDSCEFASSGTHDAFSFAHPLRFSDTVLWGIDKDTYSTEDWGWCRSTSGISVAVG